jgi:hypothetical protein
LKHRGDDDKEAGDSDEEYVTATERDLKHQAHQLKDHFEKLLKVNYLNHSYPVKHKLKDCTMMKNFMTSGALSGAGSPRETRAARTRHPFLRRQWS